MNSLQSFAFYPIHIITGIANVCGNLAPGTFRMSDSLSDKKFREDLPEGLPPEEVERLQKLQSQLTDFILRLIQAFLRTGYYTPEHPESKKAQEGLCQQFKQLFEHEAELTFMVRDEEGGQDIFVEGLMPEAQKLGRMMMKGMGELYVPKFAKYLERKDLISLTLKNRMNQTEFTRFVEIMSDPSHVETRRKEEKERFTQVLVSQGIFNISFVFNEELLGLDREIPWRARVTLSRMRKDLKMIPYFQKMSGQELHQIGKDLIRDAIRPVRQSDLLCAILRNSDLAATSENREEVIEDVIVSCLQKQYLLGTSKILLREHLALKKLQKRDAFEEKSDRLIKKSAVRLKEVGTQEAETLVEEFFRNQLISLDDLPPRLKDKILLERKTDQFLAYTEQFFQQLDQAKESEKFLALATSFVKIIPELIRRDRYREILQIVETFKTHFHQRKMWAILAGQVLEEIGTGAVPALLKEKFLAGKKEIRTAIVPIFGSLEIGAIAPLLEILKTSEDQWVRKNACEALIQIGPVAAAHLLDALGQQRISVETTCDILRVLAEIKTEQWKTPLLKIVTRTCSHEQPKLREQALHTLCLLGGKEGETLFLSGLDDPDMDVRKRAVWCLGMVKSQKGAEKMTAMLKEMSPSPSPQREHLETQIYHAFGLSGNMTVQGRTTEQILVEILEKRGLKQWLGVFDKNPLSDSSLGVICDALGKIGTKESVKVLTKLGKSREGPWVSKVKEALKKIGERTGSEI